MSLQKGLGQGLRIVKNIAETLRKPNEDKLTLIEGKGGVSQAVCGELLAPP